MNASRMRELKLLLGLAGPSALTSALRTAQLLTDQSVIGHLLWKGRSTPVFLDASALALLWMNLTMSVMTRSVGGSVNVLAAQALGAGNRRLADVWLSAGLLFGILAAAACAGLWLLTAPVVSVFAHNQTLGLPTTIRIPGESDTFSFSLAGAASIYSSGEDDGPGDPVQLAGLYARLSIGYTLPTMWMEALNSWLLAHRMIKPQLVTYTLAFALNLFLNILFVHGIGGIGGFGFVGSPVATTTTRLVQLVVLLLSLPVFGVALPSLRFREALQVRRLRVFLGQLLPRGLSATFEEIALQAVGALAGRLGAVQTATHTAMLMVFFWLTAPLYGVGAATQQRMGYHLGAGRPRAARAQAMLCFGVDMSLGLFVAATMVSSRAFLGRIFSSSDAVVHMVAAITPLVSGAYCLVGLFYASMATLGGQGRPIPVALAYFLGAFLLAPSAGYLLTFQLHCCGPVLLYGLWSGLIIGYMVTTLISIAAVCTSDWEAISKLAQERAEIGPQIDSSEQTATGNRTGPSGANAAECDTCQPLPPPPAMPDVSTNGGLNERSAGMGAPLLRNAAPVPIALVGSVQQPSVDTPTPSASAAHRRTNHERHGHGHGHGHGSPGMTSPQSDWGPEAD